MNAIVAILVIGGTLVGMVSHSISTKAWKEKPVYNAEQQKEDADKYSPMG